MFSFQRLKGLASFGWKLLLSTLITTVYSNMYQLIIGKMYTKSDVAYYNKGNNFPSAIVGNIETSLDKILLPTMSREQDDTARIRLMVCMTIKVSTYFVMPCMMGLAVCASPLVSLLLKDKWLPCVPFIRISCFSYMFFTVYSANFNSIKALGRSDLLLRIKIMERICGLTILLSTMWISVDAIAYGLAASSVLSFIIDSWPNKKLLKYGFFEQLRDMLPQMGLSCFMGAVVYCVSFFGLGSLATLAIQIPLGVIIYIAGSMLFKIDGYEYALRILKGFFKSRKSADSVE